MAARSSSISGERSQRKTQLPAEEQPGKLGKHSVSLVHHPRRATVAGASHFPLPTSQQAAFFKELKTRVQQKYEEEPERKVGPEMSASAGGGEVSWEDIYASPLFTDQAQFHRVVSLSKAGMMPHTAETIAKGFHGVLPQFQSAQTLLNFDPTQTLQSAVRCCFNHATLKRLGLTLDELKKILDHILLLLERR